MAPAARSHILLTAPDKAGCFEGVYRDGFRGRKRPGTAILMASARFCDEIYSLAVQLIDSYFLVVKLISSPTTIIASENQSA